eukprot:365798-Chlamydomonas_euryale.AAC.4
MPPHTLARPLAHTLGAADIRDTDGARRDRVVAEVRAAAADIAARRNVRHSVSIVNQDPPAACSAEIQDAVEAVAKELGLRHKRMVSRAYHDSLFMAREESLPAGRQGGISRRWGCGTSAGSASSAYHDPLFVARWARERGVGEGEWCVIVCQDNGSAASRPKALSSTKLLPHPRNCPDQYPNEPSSKASS